MRNTLLLCLMVAVFMGGCASHSQMFVNADGALYKCATSGAGLVSVLQAGKIQDDCIKGIKSAGYIEVEKAGVVGILMIQEAGGGIKIIKVTPNSPAAHAGILAGDYLVAVDGTSVKTREEVIAMLFVTAGTSVTIKTTRNQRELVSKLISVPRSEVFGTN